MSKSTLRMFQYPCTSSVDMGSTTGRFNVVRGIFDKKFLWPSDSKGLITISFGTTRCDGCSEDAAWSLVGTDANDQPSPSMNLGFIDPPFETFTFNGLSFNKSLFQDATRNYCETSEKSSCKSKWQEGATVIHEFCHSLGMLHEHQNNLPGPSGKIDSNPIKLNIDNVKAYYQQIGMSEEDAVSNVIKRYNDTRRYIGSEYDPDSIMLYALPDDWVAGPNPTRPNFELSPMDKTQLTRMYNADSMKGKYPQLTIKFVDEDAPDWKIAFVQKMISEKLCPLVYISMQFIVDGNSKLTNLYKPDTIYIPVTDKPSEPDVKYIEDIEGNSSSTSGTSIRKSKETNIRKSRGTSTPSDSSVISELAGISKMNSLKETFKNKERPVIIVIIIIIIIYLMIFFFNTR